MAGVGDYADDAKKIEDAAAPIVSILGPLILGYMERQRASKADKRKIKEKAEILSHSLGIWGKELYDGAQSCMVPVLSTTRLNAHLQAHKGLLSPKGRSNATSDWPKLLHALAIMPGVGVLGCKQQTSNSKYLQQGKMQMELAGGAFCHLVNLYGWRKRRVGKFTAFMKPQYDEPFKLSFGELQCRNDNGLYLATFTPGEESLLNGRKAALGELDVTAISNTRVEKYFKALHNGVSDDNLLWPPEGSTPLTERVRALLRIIQPRNDGYAKIVHSAERADSFLVLTHNWLERASRIKRKLLNQGGRDNSFLQDIIKRMQDAPPRTVSKLRLEAAIRRLFFQENEGFWYMVFTPSIDGEPSRGPADVETGDEPGGQPDSPLGFASATLESYKDAGPKSWKYELFTVKKEVKEVLEVMALPPAIRLRTKDARVLDFVEEDEIWDASIQVA